MAGKTDTPVVKFTPKKINMEMEKAAREAAARLHKMQNEGPEAPKPKVFKGRCLVCEGDITEKITYKYAAHGSPIIGPGSRQQYAHVHEGYHCTGCGIKYEFVPGKK